MATRAKVNTAELNRVDCTQEFKDDVTAAAAHDHLPVATWIRQVLTREIERRKRLR